MNGSKTPSSVIFLCVANSARSQLAEGLARDYFGDATRIASAGTAPTSVRPEAVTVMAEVGIDISVQKSESIEEYAAKEFEFVVTLCAEEECPWLPAGVTHLEWPLPDPAVSRVGTTEEERLQKFRDARDEIARRLHSQWPSG